LIGVNSNYLKFNRVLPYLFAPPDSNHCKHLGLELENLAADYIEQNQNLEYKESFEVI